jgi:hypothetical protein
LVEQKRFKARKNSIATSFEQANGRRNASSSIRTVTVGSSIGLDLLTSDALRTGALAGLRLAPPTAGGDFHPALKTRASYVTRISLADACATLLGWRVFGMTTADPRSTMP